MKIIRWLFGGLLLMAISLVYAEADKEAFETGKKLHHSKCITCHAEKTDNDPSYLYTRKNRKVTGLNGLKKQVQNCNNALGLELFDNEIDEIVIYLNQAFYQFKETTEK